MPLDSSIGLRPAKDLRYWPGQGAFGALAEIVQILERNPDTDWRHADGLRRRLIDPNAPTLEADVRTMAQDLQIGSDVSGEGTGACR